MNYKNKDMAAKNGDNVDDLEKFREWLVERKETEERLGEEYEEFRHLDNGVQCTAHYQRAAILTMTLTNFDKASRGVGTTKKVLIMETNEEGREMLASRLRKKGHTVHHCGDTHKALELLAKSIYDALIADCIVPGDFIGLASILNYNYQKTKLIIYSVVDTSPLNEKYGLRFIPFKKPTRLSLIEKALSDIG